PVAGDGGAGILRQVRSCLLQSEREVAQILGELRRMVLVGFANELGDQVDARVAVQNPQADRGQAELGPAGGANVAAGGDEQLPAAAQGADQSGDVVEVFDVVQHEQPPRVGLKPVNRPGAGVLVRQAAAGTEPGGQPGQAEGDR